MLTKRQREALEAIRAFVVEHGYPPTLSELCGLLGIVAKSATWRLVNILVDEGYLEKEPEKARAIRVV